MKSLINFVLVLVTLWVAARLFPNNVQVTSVSALVLTAVLLVISTGVIAFAILALTMLISGTLVTAGQDLLGFVIFVAGLGAYMCSVWLAVILLSKHLDGFTVNGVLAKLLLAICLTMFGGFLDVKPRKKFDEGEA